MGFPWPVCGAPLRGAGTTCQCLRCGTAPETAKQPARRTKRGDRMILLRLIPLILALGLFVGCGSHYWQAPGRSVTDFGTDSRQCIQEATSKYDVSEKIYRRCMRAQGWERVETNYPTDRQFRGPEDEEDFFSPPDPLSARGPALQRPADDPSCNVPTASKPAHCRR